MLLVVHILVALGSMIYSGFLLFRPTPTKFHVTYGLTAFTLISGTYLVASAPVQHLASSCISGLFYLGVVGAMVIGARYRSAADKTD